MTECLLPRIVQLSKEKLNFVRSYRRRRAARLVPCPGALRHGLDCLRCHGLNCCCFRIAAGSKVRNWKQLLGHAPPCTDSRLAWYWLNTPEVRDALGAANVRDIGHWELCTDKIDYTHDTGSMIPVHTSLTKDHGLRALIYSGDHGERHICLYIDLLRAGGCIKPSNCLHA